MDKIPCLLVAATLLVHFFVFDLHGQFVKKEQIQIDGQLKSAANLYSLNVEDGITALAFKASFNVSFRDAFITVDVDTIKITESAHNEGFKFRESNLIIFNHSVQDVVVHWGQMSGDVEIIMINDSDFSKVDTISSSNTLKNTGLCGGLPLGMISQSQWRSGLPEPNYSRVDNVVDAIIIHHSATSNSITNYTSAIRNIYLYHTEGRGWSDIGYNYVVAPDGTIFLARDPGEKSQDEVMGAHFCGNNSGTMGICMMGTYTDVIPDSRALTSLGNLLRWKLTKDELDPTLTTEHPLNAMLPIIAGHRDGCATECPGSALYQSLHNIREDVYKGLLSCGVNFLRDASAGSTVKVYPTITSDWVYLESSLEIIKIEMCDLRGRKVYHDYRPSSHDIDVSQLKNGFYMLRIETQKNTYVRKFMKQ